ncbi:MAG: hypothetical protein GYB67_07595 [Chloroflexi bacterium]|nr:hypothetical protein [Chloroflexota bacterium]
MSDSSADQPAIQILPIRDIGFDLAEYLKPADKLRPNFNNHFYLCLPLVAGNTLGWTLYNPYEFTVSWRGGGDPSAVEVECENPRWVASWFGYGTFTIRPPFFVRTSPGVDLQVRPVPNYPRPGILTLEGVVETDWLQAGFTLNFMLLMPLVRFTFPVGEPLVQFVPYPRHYIENFRAEIVTAGAQYEREMANYETWLRRRSEAQQNQQVQLDYLRGIKLDGEHFRDHQKSFAPPPFTQRPASADAPESPPTDGDNAPTTH